MLSLSIMGISPRESAGVRQAVEVGRRIQEFFPAVAEDYRGGKAYRIMAQQYGFAEFFRVGEGVAASAVRCAIIGHSGGFHNLAYSGLIEDASELEMLCREHRSRESSRKGKIVGKKLFLEKRGMHSLTHEQLSEAGRAGAYKSVAARGKVPWNGIEQTEYGVLTEIEYACELAFTPEYQKDGRTDNKKIAQRLNEHFHNGHQVRDNNTVYSNLYMRRYRQAAKAAASRNP